MTQRGLVLVLLVVGCSGGAASVAASAGSSDVPSASSVPGAPPSSTEATTERDASTAPSALPSDAGADSMAPHDAAVDTWTPPPVPYCDVPFSRPGTTYGAFPACPPASDGVDVWMTCSVAGSVVNWRCNSATPNPCPAAGACCVGRGIEQSGCGLTTRTCATGSDCAGYPNAANGKPACAYYQEADASVCVPY